MEIVNEKDNKKFPFIDTLTGTEARKHMRIIDSPILDLAVKGINDSLRNQAAARSFPVF